MDGAGDDSTGPTQGHDVIKFKDVATGSSGITKVVDAHKYKYDMSHNERGIAIIINNVQFGDGTLPTRVGSDKDAEALKTTFQGLGFKKVWIYNNVNKEFLDKVLREATKQDYTDMDCFVMAILTHGNEDVAYAKGDRFYSKYQTNSKPYFGGNYIAMHDGNVNLNYVFDKFKGNEAHPSLRGKPKLFFIQACLGSGRDPGVTLPIPDTIPYVDDDLPPVARVPVDADFLFAYASSEGHVAALSPKTGSPFMQTLCEVLHECGDDMDLLSMLTRVSGSVAYDFERTHSDPSINKTKQMPCFVSKLTKQVFFPRKPASSEH